MCRCRCRGTQHGSKAGLPVPRFISAVHFRNWEAAAEEVLISDWEKHEQRRANVLDKMMRTGRDDLGSVSDRRSGQDRGADSRVWPVTH